LESVISTNLAEIFHTSFKDLKTFI